jgi:LPXTG-motif cell wall-anchored protein
MNRFVPMATTSFQPVGYYVPQPLVVTRANGGMFGATEYGAAKKKDDKKSKKKGKKKQSGFEKFVKTTGKAAGNLAKEGAADLLKKKTGIDITGETPAEGTMPDDASMTSDAGSSGEGGGEDTKKSNMPLIIGGVVAALALAGGGFYLYKKKKASAPAAV